MKRLTILAVLLLGCAVPVGTASASHAPEPQQASSFVPDASGVRASRVEASAKQLWTSDTLNRIANDVAGAPDMKVIIEDDPTEWATFMPPDVDSNNVLGFVNIYNPYLYHQIFLSPFTYPIFGAWMTSGSAQGNEYPFAIAAMTLVHEGFHWRLFSSDESTVNACALKYLPYYLQNDFNVPPTITQTTTTQIPTTTTATTPVKHVKVLKTRVKINGRWVVRTRRVTTTTYVTKTTTTYTTETSTTDVPNPLSTTILADAADFYAHQPAPYNAGTCSV